MSGKTENTQTREVTPEYIEAFERVLAEAVAICDELDVPYDAMLPPAT